MQGFGLAQAALQGGSGSPLDFSTNPLSWVRSADQGAVPQCQREKSLPGFSRRMEDLAAQGTCWPALGGPQERQTPDQTAFLCPGETEFDDDVVTRATNEGGSRPRPDFDFIRRLIDEIASFSLGDQQ
jgi:hypothetical protein